MLAGLGVAGYAIKRLLYPVPLNDLEIGTLISLAAAGVNFAVARVMLVQGRQHNSIVLEADGKHLMTDVVTSIGIVVGLVLVLLTGITWIDPLLALIVGALILKTAGELLVRSFNGLMDHALPAEEQDRIREVIRVHLPSVAAFHLLRTRRAAHAALPSSTCSWTAILRSARPITLPMKSRPRSLRICRAWR